ncbi:hypothetical protein CDL12_28537 [Handroanthus impetiginosus]|uniref:Putative plant transposon protein domain-containing protein n=1 Tax=Handroanthus impetiginosus TaxID=429701 RepID=A0A2G9G0X5_9LAMI|nr:hypothetical protein CDL12_28537 [Handroanthus impetiginosus]
MVREFYANLKFTHYHNKKVFIRDSEVDFFTKIINYFFDTPTIDDPNEYNEFVRKPPALKTTSIPQSFLTNKVWDWLCFINAHLYPSSHFSEVNKDRAIRLYAILTGVPLDIGRYIHNAIKKSVWGGLFVSFYFLNLITALYEREGLPAPPAQHCPRGLGMEDSTVHLEGIAQRLWLEQRQYWTALYDYLQVLPNRHPHFAPNTSIEHGELAPDHIGDDD